MIMKQCVERLIIHTIQYTKRQLKWIRHRIMINSDSEEIAQHLFVLEFDEFTAADFHVKVVQPAAKILQEYFANEATTSSVEELARNPAVSAYLVNPTELSDVRKTHFKKGLHEWKNYFCETCDKHIHGEQNWQIHSDSRNHKRSVKSKEKADKRMQAAKDKAERSQEGGGVREAGQG